MMFYKKGDLIKSANDFDVIGHGCNCKHTMGAGIAAGMKKAFPEIDMADACTGYGDKDKLGTFSLVDYGDLIVLNLYTQYDYARDKVNADYEAIRNCMKQIKKRYGGKKIGLPLIGAGLAGGDWNTISEIIEEELKGENVTIIIYEKDYESLKKFNLQ